jgi:ADP-ribose pyrophosphatase
MHIEDLLQPWSVESSEVAYQALPWISVQRQVVKLPDGRRIDDYHHIDLGEHVCCCVQTVDGRLVLVRHYHHGVGKVCLGLPAGMIAAGEAPLAAVQRELLEETGYEAEDWEALGVFIQHGNYRCGKAHFFRARRAVQVCPPQPGDLEEMETVLLSPAETIAAIRCGEMPLMGSVAGLALALYDWGLSL